MFLNILKIGKEVGELKTVNKSKYIPEKSNIKLKSTKEITILEDEYQSKEENIVKDVDTLQKINNTKTVEINEDKLNDNLKHDKCDYSCKKSNTMKKHINTKHCNFYLEKESTCEEKSKPDEIVDKDKKIQISDRENCKKCDKILKVEDNARKSICQFCRIIMEYG